MPYRADGKALLQPVPAPAHFCICQTDLWVRKNSAQRVTIEGHGNSSFSRHAKTSTAKGEVTGIEAKGCFQNSAKGLWQILVAGKSTWCPSWAG